MRPWLQGTRFHFQSFVHGRLVAFHCLRNVRNWQLKLFLQILYDLDLPFCHWLTLVGQVGERTAIRTTLNAEA